MCGDVLVVSCHVDIFVMSCVQFYLFLSACVDVSRSCTWSARRIPSSASRQLHPKPRTSACPSEVSVLQSVSLNDLSNYILIANQIQEEFRGVLPTLPFPSPWWNMFWLKTCVFSLEICFLFIEIYLIHPKSHHRIPIHPRRSSLHDHAFYPEKTNIWSSSFPSAAATTYFIFL